MVDGQFPKIVVTRSDGPGPFRGIQVEAHRLRRPVTIHSTFHVTDHGTFQVNNHSFVYFLEVCVRVGLGRLAHTHAHMKMETRNHGATQLRSVVLGIA